MRFIWDQKKAATNLAKHGVSFEEGSTVFLDPLALAKGDPAHEDRVIVIGVSARSRLLFVVHVEVDERPDSHHQRPQGHGAREERP